MTGPRCSLACALIVLLPAAAAAQVLSGAAEWTVAKGTNTSDGATATNDSVWQLYTLGFTAPFLDPRLMKYNTEVSWRANALALDGGGDGAVDGHQRDVGFKLGASLFPARPFPLFVQFSRDVVGESGGYPTSAGLRGGIVVPADTPLQAFTTVTSALTAGGQLNLPSHVRVELGYRGGDTTTAGGPYEAAQRDTDLHAAVYKDSARARQSLRFQQTAFTSTTSQSFDQTVSDLDYEFTALVGDRSRVQVHTGRRQSFSLFDLPAAVVDQGQAQYALANRGDVRTRYLTTGMTWEPAQRLSFDVTGGFDQQDGDAATLTSRLAGASARLDLIGGLSVNATGAYGDRGQIFNEDTVTVVTRNGAAGFAYHAGPRWLAATLAGTRGIGVNTTPDNRSGQVNLWSGQGTLTSSWRWMSVSGGYERLRSEDSILDFGNSDAERMRGSLQQSIGAWSFTGSDEHMALDRGVGGTFTHTVQRTLTGTASLRVTRDSLLSANAGEFDTQTGPDRDRTFFYGGAYDGQLRRGVRLSLWLRREQLQATQTGTDQDNLYWFGSIEYRLRQFLFAFELRNSDQRLRLPGNAAPFQFTGRQLRLRITRKFGMRL
jgi:hypothetical protein